MPLEINTNNYYFSHGHLPKGRGGWAFINRNTKELVWVPGSRLYSEAKRWLKEQLKTGALKGTSWEVAP